MRRLEGHRAQGPVRRREQQSVRGVRERPTRDSAGAHLGRAKLGNLDSDHPWDVARVFEHGPATCGAEMAIQYSSSCLSVSGRYDFFGMAVGESAPSGLKVVLERPSKATRNVDERHIGLQ